MSADSRIGRTHPRRQSGDWTLPRLLLRPLPLALVQPVLDRIVNHVAGRRPELFSRLGAQAGTRFLIDPDELPFVLLLLPNPTHPSLTAHRRRAMPGHDASIAGSFLTLLDMVDGVLDGDALFFSRDLRVTGNTEAIVTLRNALDDLDGSVIDTVFEALGPFGQPASTALRTFRTINRRS